MAEIKTPAKEVNDSILNCKNCDSSRLCLTEGQRRQELFSEVDEKNDQESNIVAVKSIKVIPNVTKVAVNDMIKFEIEQTPFISNAPEVTWEVSDTKKAIVDKDGLLRTFEKGSIVLKATNSNDINKPIEGKLNLEIVDAPLNISLDHSTGEVTVGGGTFKLTATVTPGSTDQDVVWISSDTKVATVEGGTVTPVDAKEDTVVIITARTVVGGREASCKVTVHPQAIP